MPKLPDSYDQQLSKVIGNNIRLQRKVLNISTREFADELGISIQQMQKYETGANRISAEFIYRISKVFNINVSYFFEEQGPTAELNQEKKEMNDANQKALSLLHAYSKISNPKIRNKVLTLVEIICKENDDA